MQKLPVWRTIGAAFGFVFGAPLRLLRIGWVWFAVTAALEGWKLSAAPPKSIGQLYGQLAIGLVGGLLTVAAALSFAVAWHRAAIVGENRPWLGAFRFRRREWRFLGNGLLVALLPGVPLFALTQAASSAIVFSVRDAASAHDFASIAVVMRWFFVVGTALLLVAWFFWARLLLAFPAAAVDQPGALGRGWDIARGNWLRLYLASLLCLVPFVALGALVPLLLGPDVVGGTKYVFRSGLSVTLTHGKPLHEIASGVIQILELTVLIAFYSIAYRQLAAAPHDAAPAPMPAG